MKYSRKEQIEQLQKEKLTLSTELIECKDLLAGQTHFLDALENLLQTFGYKVDKL